MEKKRNEPAPKGFVLLHTLRAVKMGTSRMSWSPDGRWLAVPEYGGNIVIWDPVRGEAQRVLEGSSTELTGAA
jgi:WD40 repeat protein